MVPANCFVNYEAGVYCVLLFVGELESRGAQSNAFSTPKLSSSIHIYFEVTGSADNSVFLQRSESIIIPCHQPLKSMFSRNSRLSFTLRLDDSTVFTIQIVCVHSFIFQRLCLSFFLNCVSHLFDDYVFGSVVFFNTFTCSEMSLCFHLCLLK